MTILVKIKTTELHKRQISGQADFAIELSRWCKNNGLKYGVDYEWALDSAAREVHFKFFGEGEMMATVFSLRWADYL